MTEKYLKGEKA